MAPRLPASAPATPTRILASVILLSWTYGIAHDEITCRLSPEYFTLGHPILFGITAPGAMALLWGTLATVPMAILVGTLLAATAVTPRERPAEPLHVIVTGVLLILSAMALGAAAAGFAVWTVGQHVALPLPHAWKDALEPDRILPFATAWAAHSTSYAVAFAGSTILITRIWRRRGRPRFIDPWPSKPGEALRFAAIIAIAAGLLYWRFR